MTFLRSHLGQWWSPACTGDPELALPLQSLPPPGTSQFTEALSTLLYFLTPLRVRHARGHCPLWQLRC